MIRHKQITKLDPDFVAKKLQEFFNEDNISENDVYHKYFIAVLLSLAISIICFFLTIYGFGILYIRNFILRF